MVDVLPKLRANTPGIKDEPLPPLTMSTGDDPYGQFWKRFDEISSNITSLDLSTDEVAQLGDEILKCTDNDEAAELREQLNAKMREISSEGNKIRTDIEKLKADIDKEATTKGDTPDVRLKKNNFHLLLTEFANTITNFQEKQSGIKKKFSQQVVRKLQIAGYEDIDEEKAEDMIQNNPEALNQNMFQLAGSAQQQTVVNIYNTIASRHQDILEIEQRLNEVLDLFVQFSIVVHDQGRQIDNIHANISEAKDYVTKAVKLLDDSKKDQKKSRKCMWIFVICGVVLLVIVIIIAIAVPLST